MGKKELEKTRPGRKLGAEKRRLARTYLREFYETESFLQIPQKYRLAILELCPVKESHTTLLHAEVNCWENPARPNREKQNSLLLA
ncbi:hypothetical protein SpiGrapes_2325 [Sphaerochaeta pleomorpha str. Grapes]|uniref:Uncharacterized protein n=1 Tax=Sphaerochaeta pleomorpha (strain ATCC BAA-1885 / DSM 22778 / Grapes) TaxID=158190 RepID=G8QSR8_SPHPG|nr:hypothetical protein [Sphaerochaeta pleomorpha]AEV30100.1 hypothetical protein SpiGrapes_2325 [Sphaerochaeta pleomorpha str. Grapes]